MKLPSGNCAHYAAAAGVTNDAIVIADDCGSGEHDVRARANSNYVRGQGGVDGEQVAVANDRIFVPPLPTSKFKVVRFELIKPPM